MEKRRHQPVYSPLSLSLRIQWRVGLLLAALLVWAGTAVAADVYTCSVEQIPCAEGPTYRDESEVISGGWAVWSDRCPSASAGDDYHACGNAASVSGEGAFYRLPGNLEAGDFLTDLSGLLIPVEGYSFFSGGGGGDPDPEPDPDPDPDSIDAVDLQEAGNWFAASFMVVVMLWGLGKGIGLVVSVVRGR